MAKKKSRVPREPKSPQQPMQFSSLTAARDGSPLTQERLRTLDPELLLQELRSREPRRARPITRALQACGCDDTPTVAHKLLREGEAAGVPELEAVPTPELISALNYVQKVIYGTDDRLDMFQVTNAAHRDSADSVVMLVNASSITSSSAGTSTIATQNFGTAYNLCPTERFRDQPIAGFCSGFLVDPSLIATAAHCVDEANLANVRFVFGFQMRNATTAETTVPTSEIYRGIRIIGRAIGNQGTDWAVVQLDRPVLNHRHVRLRRSGKVADNAGVYVIGHPVGLPKKWAGGAVVRDNTPARYFVANLDTYGGNSGSAVFNATTHDVEGILVRGETDFVMNGSCRVSNVVPANGGRGEDCTRVSEFAALVPRNQHDFIPFNHAAAKVIQASGRWKIQVDNMWLLDFGSSKAEAQQALKIIKHYKMNTQCFVGRPGPSMEFYLDNGQATSGAMAGEDAISFNPANLQARYVSGRWKVVDGSSWILDFDQSEEEARQALSYILRYGFRFLCFVGRPGPSMTYFRK
jgi:hypothetical protein